MVAFEFLVDTFLPGMVGLLALAATVRYVVQWARKRNVGPFPVGIAIIGLGLTAIMSSELYQVHACEKWGRCDRAPAWCRDGLKELRTMPNGCRDWGPVGCDAGAP